MNKSSLSRCRPRVIQTDVDDGGRRDGIAVNRGRKTKEERTNVGGPSPINRIPNTVIAIQKSIHTIKSPLICETRMRTRDRTAEGGRLDADACVPTPPLAPLNPKSNGRRSVCIATL
ncbi:hypothetical protein Trydic_g1062 [Trypoxylus dichotomus]